MQLPYSASSVACAGEHPGCDHLVEDTKQRVGGGSWEEREVSPVSPRGSTLHPQGIHKLVPGLSPGGLFKYWIFIIFLL